jgi:ATP-dependent 26S proteasome regulatory subunit
VFKRPGRLDRIFVVPTIQDEGIAAKMLKHYMAEQWKPEHAQIAHKLTSQPGAFVREVAVHARMLAAHERQTEVSLDMLQSSVDSLLRQMKMDGSFLAQRRPLGLGSASKRRSNFDDEF